MCISCELFPPKAGTELQNALNIVSDIAEVGPHFMSVTYGAGGTSVGQTVAIARAIGGQRTACAGASDLYRC